MALEPRMGALYDYYRAGGRAAALVEPDVGRAGGGHGPGLPPFDAVEAKGIDPIVVLGQFVALVQGVPWTVDLVPMAMLHPPPEGAPRTAEEWDALPEDSPYLDGGAIVELGASVRDVLAGVDDGRLPDLAARWALIEEFAAWHLDPGDLLPVARALVALARRARQADQLLYCWMCL
ncbi:hypothetical protein [Nonomuraea pusilla]|uniref:hypothetical protein n=1 Tax=Nonomuraea pusilla TaxID=46177 RepID=UPI001160D50E|nr:hypothetical protein [Nonomuraea pusilla]